MLSRRSLLRSALLGTGALAVGGLAACSPGDDSPASSSSSGVDATQKVTYQLSWTHSVQFGGTYLAQNKGYFADQGLAVTLASGGPNVAGDANTVAGKTLVNISGGDGVARSNAEGAELVIVGAQYQKAPNTILSLASKPLKTPQDLIGARIGVSGTDTPALDAFAKINKLDNSKIKYVPTQYDPAPLIAGQVDGLFCFAIDLPVALEIKGEKGYSLLLSDHGYNPMSQVYTVLKTSLADATKRKQIVSLFTADAKGWQDFQKDYEAAAELAVKQYPDAGLDLPTQKAQAKVELGLMYDDRTAQKGFGWFDDDDVTSNLELFGILGIKTADKSLWDHSILDEVYKNGPTV